MAVEQTYNPVRQSGDGVTTRFSFGFTIYRQEDLVVQIINKTTGVADTKELATDYTVTISPTEEGGYIDFIGGLVPATTEWVFLYSDIAYTQPTSFPIGEGIREESVERMADRTVRLVQQVKAGIDRAVQLPPSADAGQIYLPEPESNKIIGWNEDGDALENKTEMDTDAQAAAEAAAAIAVAAAEDAVEAKEAAEAIASWEVASQEEAEEGTNNTKVMTPLRTNQAIDAYVDDNDIATTDDIPAFGAYETTDASQVGGSSTALAKDTWYTAAKDGFIAASVAKNAAETIGIVIEIDKNGGTTPTTSLPQTTNAGSVPRTAIVTPVGTGQSWRITLSGTPTTTSYSFMPLS